LRLVGLMPTAFNELRVGDGRVTEIVIRRGGVLVHLQDWQERAVAVTFEDVVGFEGLAAIDVDLSHAGESTDDPMIQRACRQANESQEGYRCFCLFSAWTDEPILRIVARRFVTAAAQ
jgi:hypothetical protein